MSPAPTRLPSWVRQHLAVVRALLVFTVVLGLAYPLAIAAVAQIPGLKSRAEGSLVTGPDGQVVGSRLIGQLFTDADGAALPRYFQSRPSAAGDGYDPTSASASNLGPEDVIDTPDDPATEEDDSAQSLLTQVCERSAAVGELEGVDGRRPYCAPSGVGSVLAVFHTGPGYAGAVTRAVSVNEYCDATPTPFLAEYEGVRVECHRAEDDVAAGEVVPVRGDAPARPGRTRTGPRRPCGRRGPVAEYAGQLAAAPALSLPATEITRAARWSSAASCASVSGASLVAPVTCETPYGLPSTNFSGSVWPGAATMPPQWWTML